MVLEAVQKVEMKRKDKDLDFLQGGPPGGGRGAPMPGGTTPQKSKSLSSQWAGEILPGAALSERGRAHCAQHPFGRLARGKISLRALHFHFLDSL